jgi:hypothetical protein
MIQSFHKLALTIAAAVLLSGLNHLCCPILSSAQPTEQHCHQAHIDKIPDVSRTLPDEPSNQQPECCIKKLAVLKDTAENNFHDNSPNHLIAFKPPGNTHHKLLLAEQPVLDIATNQVQHLNHRNRYLKLEKLLL